MKMCCRVFQCCCCIDLRRGVQILGVLFLIGNIIVLVSNIIAINNTKTLYANCLTANANAISALPADQDLTLIPIQCDNNTLTTVSVLKYWDKVIHFDSYYRILEVL